MKPHLAILALLFLVSSYDCQSLKNDGLVLTASLTAVTPKLNTETPKPVFRYELQLNMQLRNDSGQTLIVFRPLGDLIQKRVAFMSDFSDTGYQSSGMKPGPWISNVERLRLYRRDPYKDFAHAIDSREPLSNALIRIEPGRYYEYIEVVTVEDGYRLEIRPGQSLKEVAINPPMAEDPGFKIQYHLSLKKHHASDSFLKTLQTRWKPFGHLVLDGNGDFSITSEIIINQSGM